MSKNKKNKYNSVIFSIMSIGIISFSIYIVFKNNKINENELESIPVTLKEQPKYLRYKVKFSTYNEIVLNTNEFNKSFRIDSKTFFATAHKELQHIGSADSIYFLLLKSDIPKLHNNQKGDIMLYGLHSKHSIEIIDLDKRASLMNKEDRWGILLLAFGITFLFFAISTKASTMDFDGVMFIVVLSGIILYLLTFRF